MNTTELNGVPADVMADAKLIAECVAAGKQVPPEVASRVEREADKVTERLQQQYDILDIGGPAIRELRGELP